MTAYEISTLAVSIAVGLGQNGIVWYGIRAMNSASAERARDRKQAAQVADQHHAEAMQHHAETMQALDIQRQALESLIQRTTPVAARSTT